MRALSVTHTAQGETVLAGLTKRRSAVLGIGALFVGCGQPAPNAPISETVAPVSLTLRPPVTAEEKLLDEVWRQTNTQIGLSISAGWSVPDDAYIALETIDNARRSLRELEDNRSFVSAVMGHQLYAGEMDVEEMETALAVLENERQEVLARVGLAD